MTKNTVMGGMIPTSHKTWDLLAADPKAMMTVSNTDNCFTPRFPATLMSIVKR
jgi:hypothetical protein